MASMQGFFLWLGGLSHTPRFGFPLRITGEFFGLNNTALLLISEKSTMGSRTSSVPSSPASALIKHSSMRPLHHEAAVLLVLLLLLGCSRDIIATSITNSRGKTDNPILDQLQQAGYNSSLAFLLFAVVSQYSGAHSYTSSYIMDQLL